MPGRTLADLVLRRDTRAAVSLPWVGHASPRWEPEPLRFVASRAIVAVMGSADRDEDGATARPGARAWSRRSCRSLNRQAVHGRAGLLT